MGTESFPEQLFISPECLRLPYRSDYTVYCNASPFIRLYFHESQLQLQDFNTMMKKWRSGVLESVADSQELCEII